MKACLKAYAGAAMLAVVAAGCLDREAPDGCDGGKSTKTEVNDGAWYERKCGEDEALYRAEDKSPLHIFLGTDSARTSM